MEQLGENEFERDGNNEEYLKELMTSMNFGESTPDHQLTYIALETKRMFDAFRGAGFNREDSLVLTMMILFGGPKQ